MIELSSPNRRSRAVRYAALGEPHRLAIVDQLLLGDRTPGELAHALGVGSNLLAHHLAVLVDAGLVQRTRSHADRRRRYVRLVDDARAMLPAPPAIEARRLLFVCRHNAARSQLAAALWRRRSGVPAESAGSEPASAVHPEVRRLADRHGLVLGPDPADRSATSSDPPHAPRPRGYDRVTIRPDLVVSVCDMAGEAGPPFPEARRLHWSVADPVAEGTTSAFRRAFEEIAGRVASLAAAVAAPADASTRDRPTPHLFPASPTTDTPLPPILTGERHMTTWTPNLEIIPLQYRPLVRASIHRLADTFEGTFAPEVVERFVLESIEAMDGSKVKDFIPLFAERFAKDRLWSLAKSQGQLDTDLPTVLFLCVHNAGRSQMAAGLLQHLAGDRIKVMSGGSTPGEAVNPAAVAVMAEKGIDIRDGFPKPWTEEVVRAADVVITMGCGDACPIYPGKRYEDWVIDDPSGKDVDAVRPARDEIERRVRALMHELGVTPYDEREPAAARG